MQHSHKWTNNEWENFAEKYLIETTKESNFNVGAKETLQILKERGNELIIISARGTENEEMIKLVNEKIIESKVKIDKYYWKAKDKLKICQEENIDIMIDDNPDTCEKLSNNNIKTLYFRNIYGRKLEENKNLSEVYNWGQVLKNIKN